MLGRLWSMLLFLSLLAAIFLPIVPAVAQEAPPDLRTYETWLREALVAAQRRDRIGLEQVAGRLAGVSAVRIGSSAVPADSRWLAEAAGQPDPDFPAISARLAATLDALVQTPAPDPEQARRRLEEILSRPPFADTREPGLLERLAEWFFRLLDRLFAPLDGIGPTPRSIFAWIAVGLGALLVAGVLFYWLRGMGGALAGDARIRGADPEEGLTAGEALQQASALAQDGDYRTAVRYLYLSSLLWLDERDLLRYDRHLTNHEYLQRLDANPALRARLEPIIETFDRVWYGYTPLDAESFAAYRRQVEELRGATG